MDQGIALVPIKNIMDNWEFSQNVGTQARTFIEKKYSLNVILDKEIEIHNRLLQ